MRFLANENFPLPSIKLLRANEIEVKSIAEVASGIPDTKVIEIAQQEELIILTFDKDYGEIIFRHSIQTPPAVVFFRFKGTSPSYAGTLLLELIHDASIRLQKTFTVIEENNIRQRQY
ncbi:MAG: DUF5615 family PIN-like protein [Rufibacter sp.]